ncbi:MAG: FxsA family protein [Acidimicrobiales bacterium]
MFTRSAQALAVLALVELGVFALAATVADVLLLLLVLVASSVFGLFFLFRQTSGMIRRTLVDTRSSTASPGGEPGQLGDGGLKLLGGALLVFPGLATGLVGLLLLLPPVRAVVRPLVGARLSRLVPIEFSASMSEVNRAFRRRDVVDVNAVKKDPEGSPPKPTAPPELR